jgi:hypothetical protein
MKNEQDKKLDDLFKKRLENPDQQSGFREEDWGALEGMLDQHKKRRGIVYLLPILSSVAALILLFLGWWFLGQKTDRLNHQQKPLIAKISMPKTDSSDNTKLNNSIAKNNEAPLPKQVTVRQRTYVSNKIHSTTGINSSVTGTTKTNVFSDSVNNKNAVLLGAVSNTTNIKDSVFEQNYAKNHPLYKGPALMPQINNSNVWVKDGQIATLNRAANPLNKSGSPVFLNNDSRSNTPANSITQPEFNLPVTSNANAAQKQSSGSIKNSEQQLTAAEKSNAAMMKLLESTSPANNVKLSNKTQASFKASRFTGGIIGAQDVSGAGTFKQGKLGSKAGLVFAAGVSQKFTISTGAVYSSTPYSAGYDNFTLPYQPKVAPTSLSANCQMLDIPINIGYKVYNSGKNIVSLGTGLSSYIMLQQDYNFAYSASSGLASRDYSVPNSSSYLFKILNLNATYERQISSKAGITVQPYLKLPLADIGYSQVKLQTTGIAVGLSWNLDSSQP